ncbi:hypothetical protein MSAN_01499000 [Mycena sanguinolenta]|uniref:Uncharacterized protein n=1 Tax=Mycena sanguinolenta TaxID=230812 RepID=A0A8H6Y5P7_9AGAR|nr:hypothetical protein MSAN_01499000 [Mycena sanguinolenta]
MPEFGRRVRQTFFCLVWISGLAAVDSGGYGPKRQYGYDPQEASFVSISPRVDLKRAPNFCGGGTTYILHLENVSLNAPDSEDIIISSLSEEQYHELCAEDPIARFQWFRVSAQHPVGPGIFSLDSQDGTCARITEPLQILPEKELHWTNHGNVPDEPLLNSWVRHDSCQIPKLQFSLWFPSFEIRNAWLTQANCIFAELEEEAHVEDYVCIDVVQFTLQIVNERHIDPNSIPEGYLFICPPRDFRTELDTASYAWPACPAYWSLDPSGADRLSTEGARLVGFPAIHIETSLCGMSWDRGVYKGLRRFHEGKGLDPDDREAARRLGYPLYEVLSNRVPYPARKVEHRHWCESQDPQHCRELGHFL